ncbi:MAG: hypothetical protein ACI9KE_001003 [Polyangiales bacterium]|jgi:hypothetical protein
MFQRLFTSLVLVAACGTSSPSAPTPNPASPTQEEVQEVEAPEPLPLQEAVQPVVMLGPCNSSEECTIALDGCGAPHARLLGIESAEPATPDLCPPADYAVTEPRCIMNRCVVADASSPEIRFCDRDVECVAIHGICGDWWSVAVNKAAEGRAAAALAGANVNCVVVNRPPTPPVACLNHLCVTRR